MTKEQKLDYIKSRGYKTFNNLSDLSSEERGKMIRNELVPLELSDVIVANILKEKLSDDEFKLVIKWIENETMTANDEGLCGGRYYTTTEIIENRLNPQDKIVKIED